MVVKNECADKEKRHSVTENLKRPAFEIVKSARVNDPDISAAKVLRSHWKCFWECRVWQRLIFCLLFDATATNWEAVWVSKADITVISQSGAASRYFSHRHGQSQARTSTERGYCFWPLNFCWLNFTLEREERGHLLSFNCWRKALRRNMKLKGNRSIPLYSLFKLNRKLMWSKLRFRV